MKELYVAILALFFIVGSIVAWLSRRYLGRGAREFFVGGYRVGGFLSAMTYAATTYSAFMMVGLVGLTFVGGVAALGFELVYLASTVIILGSIGPKIWYEARRRGWVSPSEMISDLYGSKAIGIAVALVYLFTLVPYTAAQLKGIGEIFGSIALGYEYGILFAFTAIVFWILIAGLWSVATTDAFQGIWMLGSSIAIIIWIVSFLLPIGGIDYHTFIRSLTSSSNGNLLSFTWSPQMFIGLTVPWIFFALTNPQVVQRLYIPRDERAYMKTVKYFALYGFVYTIICVLLGMLFRSYVSLNRKDMESVLLGNRDLVTPFMLTLSHPILAAIAYVGITAAAISTADSIVLTVSSSIVRDLYEKVSTNPNEKTSKAISVVAVLLLLTLASLASIMRVGYIVELSVISSAGLLPLAPITIVGIARRNTIRRKRNGFVYPLLSIVVGELILAYTVVIYGFSKALTTPLLFSLPSPIWILIGSTLATIPLLANNRAS
ncbi:MAG: sodium:solute symporter family protein [Ignisphaera sp.]